MLESELLALRNTLSEFQRNKLFRAVLFAVPISDRQAAYWEDVAKTHGVRQAYIWLGECRSMQAKAFFEVPE